MSKTKQIKASQSLKIENNDSVSHALTMLLAGEEDVKAEGKETFPKLPVPTVFPVSMIAAAKSVFAPGKTYRFRMIKTAQLVSSGAGALNLSTAVYPSLFANYSALSALFTECRLRSTKIQYVMQTPTTIPMAMVSSFDPASAGAAPTSYTACCQMIGSKIFNTWNTAVSPLKNTWNPKVLRPFSYTSASATGTDPSGGVIGAWNHSIFSAVGNTQAVAIYIIEVDYEFRNPQ